MKLLVIGHPQVIDANRKFWGIFAKDNKAEVDVIAPETWSSNLNKHIPFNFNPQTDSFFRKYFPVKAYFRGNGSLYFYNPLTLYKIFLQNKYDVFYVNQETWAASTLMILVLKWLSPNRKAKLFLYVQQNLKKEKYKILHPYERLVSHFVDAFLYCSEGVKDVLRWKGIQSPCEYFPLPFDEESYKVNPTNANPGCFRLGYLGRLSEEKGIALLLNACDELKKRNFNFSLVIGGNGPLVEEVKKKAYVQYLGLIPHNQAHTFYDKIDCFILPSQTWINWKEQFGRVIVESFGAGKPVIGSSSGSIPEVMGKVNWPWVFKEDSVTELINLILKMDEFLKTQEGQDKLQKSIALNYQQFTMKSVSQNIYQTFAN